LWSNGLSVFHFLSLSDFSLKGIITHCRLAVNQTDEHLGRAAQSGLIDEDFDYGLPAFHSKRNEFEALLQGVADISKPDIMILKKRNKRKSVDTDISMDEERAKRVAGGHNSEIQFTDLNRIMWFLYLLLG